MSGYRPPLRDIRFVLEHVVDLPGLSQLPGFEHADPDTVHGVLEEFGRLASDVIAPLNRVGDSHGCKLDAASGAVTTPPGWADAYHRYVEAGWGAVPFDPEFGGGGFPWAVGLAIQELVTSASMAFSLCPLLTQGAIDMLTHHGSPEQQALYLERMITGEWTGTMNLTEPEAGSDVGALRAKAEPAGDGSWRISGQKIFITYGEHDLADNIVHLVLARVPDAPPGTKGISCFIVPKFLVGDDGSLGERNAVTCVSIEHKLGIHGSPTCVMAYDDAVGYLIGEPNEGMRYMFTMMNNARLSVGLEGLAVAERAYQESVDFAQERRQGRSANSGKTQQAQIIDHADVRRMLLTMKAQIEAMRCLLYSNAEAIDLSRKHSSPEVREAARELVELYTPISKAWCTDLGNELTSLAVQIHGGMGFIEEAGVAQHYRDVRIAAIYEGTNGIQAIDLVGRKLTMRGGGVVRDFLDRMAGIDMALGAVPELEGMRVALADGVAALREASEWLLEHGNADPADALAGATPYLRMFGTVIGGWLLARSALAAHALLRAGEGNANGFEASFFETKVVTARFYAEQLLPQARGLLPAVTAGKRDLFALPVESF